MNINANTQVNNWTLVARKTSTPVPAPVVPAVTTDLVSLSGKVLDPGGLCATVQRTAQMAAGNASGLPGLVLAHFSATEWAKLNPGQYHDQNHPIHVANTVGEVAANLGRSPERVEFLQQVALLHDADERIDLKTGKENPVSPARVPVTLEWMDRNEAALNARLGWDAQEMVEAKALIARSDFPFNSAPKNLGTRYDGQTPVQVYEGLLQQIPQERRQAVMEDGLLLRFADQTGNYTANREQSRHYIEGLAQEFQGVGVNMSFETLAKGSPAFLATAGTDLEEDWKIADHLHLSKSSFTSRQDLLQALPGQRRQALENMQAHALV